MTAAKNETLAGGAAQGFGNSISKDTEIIRRDETEGKEFQRVRAEFALRGYCLTEAADGSLLIHRWNLAKPVPDLRAASVFLRQIGGAA